MVKQLAFVGGWIKEVEVGDVEFVRRARKLFISNHLIQQEFLSRSPAQSAGSVNPVLAETTRAATQVSRAAGSGQRAQGEGG